MLSKNVTESTTTVKKMKFTLQEKESAEKGEEFKFGVRLYRVVSEEAAAVEDEAN